MSFYLNHECAGEWISSKLINVQAKIRLCRAEVLFKINKHACTSLQYTRVTDFAFSFLNSFFASMVPRKNFGQCFMKLVTVLHLLRATKCFLFSFLWPSKTLPFLFGHIPQWKNSPNFVQKYIMILIKN